MKKYVLTDEFIRVGKTVLRRVKYIATGTLGGFIESYDNLAQDGMALVLGTACVYGKARVCESAFVFNNAKVYGDARIRGSARVYDNAQVYGSASVTGEASVHGNAQVYGEAYISGRAYVYDNATVMGSACVKGEARVHGEASVYGDSCVIGETRITGGSWGASPLQIQGSRYFFNVSGKDEITVGCTVRTIERWLETYEHAFARNAFTDEERREYIQYFNLASDMYDFGIKLPLPEKTTTGDACE
jgi:carbonic anhydrase/acetyltransferase-like protein (isoleucine patch superfamily)